MTVKKLKKDLLKRGRKTQYKPEYCDMLIEHRKKGSSYESFAAIAGVSIATLYTWEKIHPDFLEAKEIGYPLALLKWEELGMLGTFGKIKGFIPASFIYSMKCRFRDQYTEKVEVETNGNVEIRIAKDEEDL